MSGTMMVIVGIGLVILSVLLFVVSIVFRRTTGRKIKETLKREYE